VPLAEGDVERSAEQERLLRLIAMCVRHKTFINLAILSILVLIGFCLSLEAVAADLSLNSQYGKKNSTVSFHVTVESAPNDVASFGLEVQYDPSILRYKGCYPGDLVSGFDFFNANNASPGIVRAGGFVAADGGISRGERGTLLSLSFNVVGHDDCQVRLVKLKDDIKTWNTQHGRFTGDHMAGQETDTDSGPPTNDAHYDSSSLRSHSNEPSGNTSPSSFPAYSTSSENNHSLASLPGEPMNTPKKSVKEPHSGKKRVDNNTAFRKKNVKGAASVSDTRAVKHQIPSDLSKHSAGNPKQERTGMNAVRLLNGEHANKSAQRVLVLLMFLFGAICCIAIGLLILFLASILLNIIIKLTKQRISHSLSFAVHKRLLKLS
jgi:hypothetical protein